MKQVDSIIKQKNLTEPIPSVPREINGVFKKNMPLRSVAILMTFLMTGVASLGLFSIERTAAYFSDREESKGNFYIAGDLDFTLAASNWVPEEKALDLLPGDEVSRTIDVVASGSLGFQYTVSSTQTSGDSAFCGLLNLNASLDGSSIYEGSLNSFGHGPVPFAHPEAWLFTASLPTSSPVLNGEECGFDLVFSGFQENLPGNGGFKIVRKITNLLAAGNTSSSGDQAYSPIADSYIKEDSADKNYGSTDKLKVRSRNNNKNNRSFVRFDFHLPASTQVLSSVLKLLISDAPAVPRMYEAHRVSDAWTEFGVNWTNQPSIAGSPSNIQSTGTSTHVRMAWEVTPDVQGFVAGVYPNNGWRIKDSVENGTSSRTTQFRAREDSHPGDRPVLEIAFIAPVATTTHLVVNEVYSWVGSGKGSDPKNEWVEIYNPTDAPVNISGWYICDASVCDSIPTSTSVAGRGFALLTPDDSTWERWLDIPADVIKIVIDSHIGNGLSKSGDSVVLKNASSTVVDAVSYGTDISQLNPPVPSPHKGNSIARVVKGYDTDSANDWIINATPNPGVNPGSDGIEIMRFTDGGVEVAPLLEGLEPLTGEPKDDTEGEEDEVNEIESTEPAEPAEPTETTESIELVEPNDVQDEEVRTEEAEKTKDKNLDIAMDTDSPPSAEGTASSTNGEVEVEKIQNEEESEETIADKTEEETPKTIPEEEQDIAIVDMQQANRSESEVTQEEVVEEQGNNNDNNNENGTTETTEINAETTN